jgi:RalBP1-associated Eps domain-containing protein
VTTIRLDSQPPIPQPRSNLSNTLLGSTVSGSQRTSAFEVYRKPSSKSRNSQSPPQPPSATEKIESSSKSAEYEKQVLAISDSLRQVRFKNSEQNSHEVLKHLKDQNVLLMRLCKDLSEELMSVQRKKEEFKVKFDQK